MDVRVGLWRRLSAEELMLLKCGVGEDSWESLGLQGNPTSPFWRRSALGFLWKKWCWSWNSSILATSCEELTHWKRLWCWEGLGAGGEGEPEDEMAGWHHWLGGESQGTPGVGDGQGGLAVLRFMGSQRVGHDWATELNWTDIYIDFPGGSDSKASACSGGDPGSVPGLGRSPGEGNGNPLQYSCLENSMDWESLYIYI